MDKWQCNRCGEEFEVEKGKKPLKCDNPNCKERKWFQALTGPHTFFNRDKFVPGRMAELIKQKITFKTHLKSGIIYAYGNGSYTPDGEQMIRSEVREQLGPELCKENYANEVVSAIEETTYTQPEEFEAPIHLINVKNGTLNIETLEFTLHTPEIVFLNELPAEYNVTADCPAIKKFLSEILNPDDIPLIQEIIGYTLLRDYPFAKAVMLLGSGSNGKSTLLSLIAALLGRHNVTMPSLQDLVYNRFARAELFGKLANIHADLPSAPLKQTGVFKMLTGQDVTWAEQKHRDPFEFKNYAKLLYSANELPLVDDTSLAFWRRWIVIKFPRIFADDDPATDPHILKKLTTPGELSGFFNWALGGLKRLLANGKFSVTRSRTEIESEWITQTDSLRAFVTRHTAVDPDCFAIKEDFYTAYQEFCTEQEITPCEKGTVGRRLPTLLPVVEFHPKIGNKQRRAWKGVRFSEEYEKYHQTTDITDITAKNNTFPADNRKNSSVNNMMSEKGVISVICERDKKTLEKVEKPVPSVPSVLTSELKTRLFDTFGVDPFKPSELSKHFSKSDLVKLTPIMDDMYERGELMMVLLESGEYAWQLVRK